VGFQLDFLEFRDFLFPASGFQSKQFRLLEVRMHPLLDAVMFACVVYDSAHCLPFPLLLVQPQNRLGLPESQRLVFGKARYCSYVLFALRYASRGMPLTGWPRVHVCASSLHAICRYLNEKDAKDVVAAEHELPTLHGVIQRWLERTPFMKIVGPPPLVGLGVCFLCVGPQPWLHRNDDAVGVVFATQGGFDTWKHYQRAVEDLLKSDEQTVACVPLSSHSIVQPAHRTHTP